MPPKRSCAIKSINEAVAVHLNATGFVRVGARTLQMLTLEDQHDLK
jgi:hypothetical protein